MRCSSSTPLAALALALAAVPAIATTYVPVSDGALVERATVVGVFEVVSAELAPTAMLATDYQIRLDTPLKGDLGAATALVRVLGGDSGDGGLRLSGLPVFTRGERVLLFLVPRHDGVWGIAHLVMGAFRSLQGPDGPLWVRPQLEEATALDPGGRPVAADASVARDRDRFLSWIADRAAGREPAADYLVEVEASALRPRFTVFRDPDDQFQLRWFDFDAGFNVAWRSANQGPEGYPDGGQAAAMAGLAAWSNLTQTNIELPYLGQGPVDSGFEDADGVNTMLFEDPHGEMDEPFDCSEGGVLAIGGPFYYTDVLRYKSQSWHPIAEGVIITNKDIACFLRGNNNRLAEILGHELGHTLGLGHSCGDSKSPDCSSSAAFNDALMRATVHDDNRGASLRSDDMAAGRALYGSAGSGLPRAPRGLEAELDGDDVSLSWNDRSSNELGFHVYRRLGGGPISLVGQTGPNVAAFTDLDLAPGSWSYEVRAWNDSGESASSNQVTVAVEDTEPGAIRFSRTDYYGSEATGTAEITIERFAGHGGVLAARLRTADLSAQSPFDYEAKDVVVTWANGEEGPKVVTVAVVDDFSPESSELIELLLETVPAAGQVNGLPLGSAAIAIADNDGSPGCAPSDRSLCLLNGRFEVEVEWRNQRNGMRGFGHALGGGDQSGYFWFFQSANLELIVKALDGRPVNGAHWFFYGALSDVEYWITVTDTASGARSLYRNAPGNICGVGDIVAFPDVAPIVSATPSTRTAGAGAASLLPREGCAAGSQSLCLLGGRFEVKVSWRNHRNGNTGVGTAIPWSDQTGFFWFFNADNIELVVKALDGQGVNGNFWVFYGALSDVEYTITVTDTLTPRVHYYSNVGGNICGVGDIFAFPGD